MAVCYRSYPDDSEKGLKLSRREPWLACGFTNGKKFSRKTFSEFHEPNWGISMEFYGYPGLLVLKLFHSEVLMRTMTLFWTYSGIGGPCHEGGHDGCRS